ncbi:MAG: hypothetical protein IPG45_28665 [Deltaproteobacteria bacterium]|nr:hypothetical protein [Deltaproteobacteria bacterium]
MESPPNLLIADDLVDPIREAQRSLAELQAALLAQDGGQKGARVVREGLFVIAVARLETAVSDTHIRYLSEFPQKISKELQAKLEDLQLARIERVAARQVEKLSYQSLSDYRKRFSQDLSLNEEAISQLPELLEIKESRNLLLHNNLFVNDSYLAKTGNLARSRKYGDRLDLDAGYVSDAFGKMEAFLAGVHREIEAKYAGPEYSRAGAFRRLWDWAFRRYDGTISPMCAFDDYWDVSEDGAGIHARACEKWRTMSSSELVMLWLFRIHYNHSAWRHLEESVSIANVHGEVREMTIYLLRVLPKLQLASGSTARR